MVNHMGQPGVLDSAFLLEPIALVLVLVGCFVIEISVFNVIAGQLQYLKNCFLIVQILYVEIMGYHSTSLNLMVSIPNY